MNDAREAITAFGTAAAPARRAGAHRLISHRLIARGLTPLLVAAAVLLGAARASAVVIYRQGQDKPLMGYLLSQDAQRVIVGVPLPEGRIREMVVPRSDISSMIETVDRQRLQALNHENPQAYRDYGEELSEKRQDPEARDTAIRLFVISIWLDPDLARSAMLGMIRLARSPREEARFRALAYLLDEEHDRGVLKTPRMVVEAPSDLDDAVRTKIGQLVRRLRQGRADDAKRLLADPAVNRGMERFDDIVSKSEIQNAALGGFVGQSLIAKLVTVELALESQAVPTEADDEEGSVIASWDEGRRANGYGPLPVIKLETITEFDPRECLYRDGKWIDPDRK